MITLVTLIGTGGFLVTAFSYILGVIGIFTNFSAVGQALAGFITSFFR